MAINQNVLKVLKTIFPNKYTHVEPLGAGYSSQPYKVTNELGTFIALTPKSDKMEETNYAKAYAILKGLERRGYPYAPRPIYISPDRTVLIMTYISDMSLKDAKIKGKERLVERLLMALLELQKIPIEICSEEYQVLEKQALKPVTIQDDVNHFLVEWGSIAASGKPHLQYLGWLQQKTDRMVAYSHSLAPSKYSHLNHGDTSEGNVLLTAEEYPILIDWAGSEYRNYPSGWYEYGIAYLTTHVRLFQDHKSLVFDLTCKHTGIEMESLLAAVRRQMEFIKLCDISWAIMMHARSAAGEIRGNPKTFLAIARQRIQDYETQFEGTGFLDI